MEGFIKAKEVAEYLQIDEKTVFAWANKGFIKSYRFGRCVRFRMSEIIEWAEHNETSENLYQHTIDQQ